MYIAESVYRLDDQASKTLIGIARNIEMVHKTMLNLRTATSRTNLQLATMGTGSARVRDSVSSLNTHLGTMDRRMGTLATATKLSTSTMEGFEVTTLNTTNTMAGMTLQAERLNRAMGGIATSTKAAGMAGRGFGAGGGGAHGKGGGGFGHFVGTATNAAFVAMFGAEIAKTFMKPTLEYQHELALMRMMPGINRGQVKQAEKQASSISQELPQLTNSENMKAIREAYGMTGDFDRSIKIAPMLQKLKVAFTGASSHVPKIEGHESDLAQTVIKAAEMTGRQYSDKELFGFAQNVLKSYISTGQLSSPSTFAQVLKYARGGKIGKDDKFLFGVMPYLIQEMSLGGKGGGSRGIGPMISQLDSVFVQGKIPKSVVPLWTKIGMLASPTLNTTTTGTIATNGIKNQKDFIKNPFEAITGNYGTQKGSFLGSVLKDLKMTSAEFEKLDQSGKKQILTNYVRGLNQTVQEAIMQFVINEKGFRREMAQQERVPGLEEILGIVKQDPAMKLQEVSGAFTDLLKNIGSSAPVLVSANVGLTAVLFVLKSANQWFIDLAGNLKTLVALNPELKDFIDSWKTGTKEIMADFKAATQKETGPLAPGMEAQHAAWLKKHDFSKVKDRTAYLSRDENMELAPGMPAQHEAWLQKHDFPRSLERFGYHGGLPASDPAHSNKHYGPPSPPVQSTNAQTHHSGKVGPDIHLNFMGIELSPKQIQEVITAVSRVLMRHQLVHNATNSRAGGTHASPFLQGSG